DIGETDQQCGHVWGSTPRADRAEEIPVGPGWRRASVHVEKGRARSAPELELLLLDEKEEPMPNSVDRPTDRQAKHREGWNRYSRQYVQPGCFAWRSCRSSRRSAETSPDRGRRLALDPARRRGGRSALESDPLSFRLEAGADAGLARLHRRADVAPPACD